MSTDWLVTMTAQFIVRTNGDTPDDTYDAEEAAVADLARDILENGRMAVGVTTILAGDDVTDDELTIDLT